MQGFVHEEEDVPDITTAYTLVALDGGSGNYLLREPQGRKRPQSAYWSHLDLVLYEVTPTVATASIQLFWDAAGDDPASAEVTAIALSPGLTDTSLRTTSVALRVSPTAPSSNQVTKKLYLAIKVDAGEATLTRARLHWKDQE